MNAHASLHLTSHLTDALRALALPSRADILADAWRGNLRRIDDCLLFIRQHQRTIAQADVKLPGGRPLNRPAYVSFARGALAAKLITYRAAVRTVSEAEQDMDRLGVAYARSSDDWRDDPALACAYACPCEEAA